MLKEHRNLKSRYNLFMPSQKTSFIHSSMAADALKALRGAGAPPWLGQSLEAARESLQNGVAEMEAAVWSLRDAAARATAPGAPKIM